MRQSSLMPWSATPFLNTSRHELANDQNTAGTWARIAWLSGRGVLSPGRAQPDAWPPGEHAMGARATRVLLATAACLLWLNGCESSTRLGDLFQSKADTGAAAQDDPIATGTVRPTPRDPPAAAKASPDDELSLGKKYFQAGNFGLAERHFR